MGIEWRRYSSYLSYWFLALTLYVIVAVAHVVGTKMVTMLIKMTLIPDSVVCMLICSLMYMLS